MQKMSSIIINKSISSGAPIIRGRRLTVFNVVTKVSYEDSLKTALDDYEITLDEAKDAVNYCSALKCQEDSGLIKFCSGCILRTLQEEGKFNKENYKEIHNSSLSSVFTISKDGKEIFLGSLQELNDEAFGKVGWLLALEDKKKYPELG